MSDPRRSIPGIDRLLASTPFLRLLEELPREIVVAHLKQEVEQVRARIASGAAGEMAAGRDPEWYAERVRGSVERLAAGSLRRVLNATGVLLHTNLGRAPLAAAAIEAIRDAAGYATLEYDTHTGGRGSRYDHCRELLAYLTGAEDALVVNNNAAALVLALNTVAQGRDVLISRGELVEIGGAFRVPEIMARSGARLHEVGATNRTHLEDYRAALSSGTGAILKVHPSNFTMAGYTAEATVPELARLAAESGVPLVHDIGSGLLLEPALLGLPDEPTAQASIAHGADAVTFSGDKLLGGPQCGIIAGRAELIERMRRNPLCRALRVDKLTLAALAATLRLYLEPARAFEEIPVLRMLRLEPAELEQRAQRCVASLGVAGIECEVRPGCSTVGGGACPGAALPTSLIHVTGRPPSASELERRLRTAPLPVIARITDDSVAFDLRTVEPEDDAALCSAIIAAMRETGA